VIWLLLLVADGCGQSGGAEHSGSLIVTVTVIDGIADVGSMGERT